MGLSTGLLSLDKITYGYHPATLVIIAARPGQGKTALAINQAIHMVKQGVPVLFFSIEMSTAQLFFRVASIISGENYGSMRTGKVHHDKIVLDEYNLPLFIDDTPALTLAQFKERSRDYKRKHGVKCIFVDYLQLMRTVMNYTNREQEVAEISRGLKNISKELNVPVVALAQLKRGDGKEPVLESLRESGQIEADAEVVILIHDDSAFTVVSPIIKLIIPKNRGGKMNVINVVFDKEHQKFINP